MSELDELKSRYSKQLDDRISEHEIRNEAELAELRAQLLRNFSVPPARDVGRRTARLLSNWSSPQSAPLQPLVDLSGSGRLKDLDQAFIQTFELGKYYPVAKLHYPTVYCDSLEEFFVALVEQMDLSTQARKIELERMIQDARDMAESHGGGIFGYNLPGKGAYLNGWLFTFKTGIQPRQAFSQPHLARRIYQTAAHEKLGHGFLSVYGALGQVKSRLGLTMMETAACFGLRLSDNPTSSLRREQSNLILMVSQLLEEGLATWLENILVPPSGAEPSYRRYNPQQVIEAIQSLPANLPERTEVQQALLNAILLLLGEEPVSLEALHQAVMIVEVVGAGLDEYIGEALGQPLRYAVGELLMTQAERNLGASCVPYAALIASNVTFDPSTVSLADLRDLLNRDTRLHPDARLAALSHLVLNEKNNVVELAGQAFEQLSLSVPKELRKQRLSE